MVNWKFVIGGGYPAFLPDIDTKKMRVSLPVPAV
jgi:hypothetical protein